MGSEVVAVVLLLYLVLASGQFVVVVVQPAAVAVLEQVEELVVSPATFASEVELNHWKRPVLVFAG